MKRQTNSLLAVLSGISFFALTAGAISTVSAAQSVEKSTQAQKVEVANLHGNISEVINASGYTYVAIEVEGKQIWAAGPPSSFKVGDKIGFSTKMSVPNFHSKSLKRDFETIYFVDGFITEEGKPSDKQSKMSLSHGNGQAYSQPQTSGKITKNIVKVAGGKTIAEIYEQKNDLKNKPIRVKGEVTKFSENILGKNWIHIRDSSTGTDLTATTSDTTSVGDVVVLKGIIELDKDFGYGYVYPVILSEAQITQE